jgi:two-component system cell cycle sensor histidine kinase/response regulator CckA
VALGPLRVLIVEDSALDAELLVAELLRGGYDVEHTRVETAREMADALAGATWDVVVSDHELPGFSGPAALALLQESGLDLPFIVISGRIGEELAVSSLKAGADDFLIKGRLARLIPVIERERREVGERREHQRAAEALRRSEAQYRSLVDGAAFGIYRATIDGRFVTANPALVAMLGCASVDELIGIGLQQLFVDPDVPADLIRRSRERAHFAGEEALWQRKNGTNIRVRLSGRLIDAHDTSPALFEGIVEDVTEQHRLHEQLRQAQKMEAIGQLAGGVAHDFNNMLTAILGYSELLQEQIGPDKPIGRDLRQIQAAAERAADLTRQLLAFSRKQVLALTAVNLSDVVQRVEPMLRRLLGERITIVTDLAGDLGAVTADVSQLEHLLINLAVNARDAMPQGGELRFATVRVTLDAAFAEQHPGSIAGIYNAVRVTDSGTGMPAGIKAQIFEPFFTTKERGQGTGLGLAAVYGTVKQFGGYIDVESELGRGTTFTIYLPQVESVVAAAPAGSAISSPVGHETILLVEDEGSVRAFAKITLERFGYRVVEADSAERALEVLESLHEVHLLLTDVVLPRMDGPELAERVTDQRPATRVLLMSGYAAGFETSMASLRWNTRLLAKPFTGQTLLTRTREALDITARIAGA